MSDVFSSANGNKFSLPHWGRELEGRGSFTSSLTLPLKGEGKRFFAALRMTMRMGWGLGISMMSF